MTLVRRPSPFGEIRRGSFSRSVRLPNGLEPDKAAATFETGTGA